MPFHAYASFKGTKQGQFKGESKPGERRDKWTEVLSIEMGSRAPLDPKSGQPKGARQHGPLTITKEVDEASPQLLQAHWTSEILQSVNLEFTKPSGPGPEQVHQRVTLTNATISKVERYVGLLPRNSPPGKQYENVTFQFGDLAVSGGGGFQMLPGQVKRFGKWG